MLNSIIVIQAARPSVGLWRRAGRGLRMLDRGRRGPTAEGVRHGQSSAMRKDTFRNYQCAVFYEAQ